MNTCKEFKDLILTDYIDSEIDSGAKARLDEHLLTCVECQQLVQEVKDNIIAPFKNVQRETVPAHIWQSIKEVIETEDLKKVTLGSMVGRWMESFSFLRLAPVVVTLTVLIVVGSTFFHSQQLKQVKDKEQSEYLVSVLGFGQSSVVAEAEEVSSTTPIEQYFL